ncbi:hypothetical protein Hanom_Chr05g00463761 [Helianthus anomalus]
MVNTITDYKLCKKKKEMKLLHIVVATRSKIPFSSPRFGQFCDFHPKVCMFASGFKRFEILPLSSAR